MAKERVREETATMHVLYERRDEVSLLQSPKHIVVQQQCQRRQFYVKRRCRRRRGDSIKTRVCTSRERERERESLPCLACTSTRPILIIGLERREQQLCLKEEDDTTRVKLKALILYYTCQRDFCFRLFILTDVE